MLKKVMKIAVLRRRYSAGAAITGFTALSNLMFSSCTRNNDEALNKAKSNEKIALEKLKLREQELKIANDKSAELEENMNETIIQSLQDWYIRGNAEAKKSYEKNLADLKAQYENAPEILTAAQDRNTKLQKQLLEKMKDWSKSEENRTKAEEYAKSAKEAKNQLEIELSTLQTQKSEVEQDLEALKAESSNDKSKIADLENNVLKLTKQITSLTAELDKKPDTVVNSETISELASLKKQLSASMLESQLYISLKNALSKALNMTKENEFENAFISLKLTEESVRTCKTVPDASENAMITNFDAILDRDPSSVNLETEFPYHKLGTFKTNRVAFYQNIKAKELADALEALKTKEKTELENRITDIIAKLGDNLKNGVNTTDIIVDQLNIIFGNANSLHKLSDDLNEENQDLYSVLLPILLIYNVGVNYETQLDIFNKCKNKVQIVKNLGTLYRDCFKAYQGIPTFAKENKGFYPEFDAKMLQGKSFEARVLLLKNQILALHLSRDFILLGIESSEGVEGVEGNEKTKKYALNLDIQHKERFCEVIASLKTDQTLFEVLKAGVVFMDEAEFLYKFSIGEKHPTETVSDHIFEVKIDRLDIKEDLKDGYLELIPALTDLANQCVNENNLSVSSGSLHLDAKDIKYYMDFAKLQLDVTKKVQQSIIKIQIPEEIKEEKMLESQISEGGIKEEDKK